MSEDTQPATDTPVVEPRFEWWFQWKQVVVEENDKGETPTQPDGMRFINVQADPYEYEFSVGELLFRTKQAAIEALDDFDVREEAEEDNWVLVHTLYVETPWR